MAFSRPDAWVWDFWFADDGEQFHMFYLFAPRALGDPELRHRNARIGHATSPDLIDWADLGEVLAPGPAGAFDETATWTGCVVRDDDGLWRMFYTGSVFTSPDSVTNVESIGFAVSTDLHTWAKQPFVLRADPRWYEVLGDSEWPEEAWRDPWVFRDPEGAGWHMLITARSREGHVHDRGVVGHAWSADLSTWEARPPLSAPARGFDHLEVMQLASVDGRDILLFSAPRGAGAAVIWVLNDVDPLGPYRVDEAEQLTDRRVYSGRATVDRERRVVLLAFELGSDPDGFVGGITDPIPLPLEQAGRSSRG